MQIIPFLCDGDMPDIDIDFKTNFDPTDIFEQAIPASMVKNNDLMKHPCGHYFQQVPIDGVTNLAAIPYEEAEVLGYFKIDFLHLSVLDHFKNKGQIRELLKYDPDWSLLQDEECVVKLFQISKHHSLLCEVKPQSIQELADCIALIRPGKRVLLERYLRDPTKVRPMLYRSGDDDKSAFKRSHAIAYAMTIVLQLHLIEAKLL